MRLHRSNRLERLFGRLLEVCAEPLLDPLAREWIVIQNPGMGRWLERRWAQTRGVATLLHFPLPARALGELAALLFAGDAGEADAEAAWERAALRWRVFRLLPDCAADPAFAPLHPYLKDGPDGEAARFRLSGRIAAVFDQYMTYRPELLPSWEAGEEPDAWQARLWRRLCAEGASPPSHRARKSLDFLRRLQRGRGLRPAPDCPVRLHLFGLNSLPPLYLELFTALARRIETHCYQLSPCRGYWHDLARRRDDGRLAFSTRDNSLLEGLGKVGRDFASLLMSKGFEKRADDLYEEPEGDTLLAALQRGLLDAGVMPGDPADRTPVPADDRSLGLHIAWSPLGEVMALRDFLLDCFADRGLNLTPDDILVAAPDIDRYAGAVRAVFGEAEPRIPFALADRPTATETTVPGLFLAFVDFLDSRCAVPDLLELLEYPALHRRFGLEAEDLPRARRLLREAGAVWGLDEAQRDELGLAAAGAEHSLRHGLDRLLLGYAMGEADLTYAGLCPCPLEGENAQIVLSGLLDLYAALRRGRGLWRRSREAAAWPGLLLKLQETFLHPEEDVEGQRGLREAVRTLADEMAQAGQIGPVDGRTIRLRLGELLDERANAGGGRAFLSGRVTFCNMVPTRSLPFKVICLLGLNDGEFPRAQQPPAFDRMAARPRPGDRNRRDDDRYLFLEAILSARSRLYLSWVGRSRLDGKERPPSPVVSELRDHLDAVFRIKGEPEGALSERLTRLHPMQPFGEGNFNGEAGPRSYDADWLPVAEKTPPALPESRLPAAPGEDAGAEMRIDLADFFVFWRNPARHFLRRRLGMRLLGGEELPPDSEPFALDGLEKYGLRDEIIRRRLQGQAAGDIGTLLAARGLLPQGHFAEPALAIDLHLPDAAPPGGVRLCGQLDKLYVGGRVCWGAGRAEAALFVEAWLGHLVLAASAPAHIPVWTRLAAWAGPNAPVASWTFAPLPPDEAASLLAPWLAARLRGRDEALPFFPKSAWAWAESLHGGGDEAKAAQAALNQWRDDFQRAGEHADPAFRRLFPAADPREIPGFAELAGTLLPPLLDHLEDA